MSYSYALGGSGWRMVPCMVTFLSEVRDCVNAGLLDVTNLGQIGDARHQAEPTSRHNPARAPNGEWYVCAADFGGKDYAKLAEFHRALWNAHDPRIYRYGFSQRGDGYGLSWETGNWKWTGRDQGHCHFDVTMRDGSLNSAWWVDSLASTAPWGLANWLRTGSLTAPITPEDELNDADKKWLLAQWEAQRLLERRDIMEQASKSMRGDVVPVVADLAAQVKALSDRVQALRTELNSKG